MKKTIFILLSCAGSINLFAQTSSVTWGSPVNVGTGSIHNNIYPRLTLVGSDNPLVVWEDDSPLRVFSSRWTGSAFSTPVVVHNSGVTPFVANWAGAEVGASGDTAFVVFTTDPAMTGKAYAVRTIDGGVTYADTVRVDQLTGNIPRFASVAVMPGGNPVVNFMSIDGMTMGNAEYTVTRSVDGGASFLPSVTPVNPGNVCDCCPGSMAISGTKQALLYRNNISNLRDMWASFSTDASVSYPVSAEIDTTTWYIASCPSSGPSGVIIGDSLVYTWMSDVTGDSRVYIGSMNINDQQIGQHRQIYPVGINTQNYPVIAGKGDTLGIVWLGYNGGMQDVLFAWSVTGAAGIGNKIDTLTKSSMGNQFRPDITFNNGKFHVVYSDDMGSQVKYLKGTVSSILSVDEANDNASLDLFAHNMNGSIEVMITSQKNIMANISIVNALGQRMKQQEININAGQNKYSLPHQLNAGIYFIVITTNKAEVFQKKVVVAK